MIGRDREGGEWRSITGYTKEFENSLLVHVTLRVSLLSSHFHRIVRFSIDHGIHLMDDSAKERAFLDVLQLEDVGAAREILRKHQYDLERAINAALNPPPPTKKVIEILDASSSSEEEKHAEGNDKVKDREDPQPEVKLCDAWRECYSQGTGVFIDPAFPPKSESLDGRREGNAQTTVQCHCGMTAAAKTVQSDGPNYGRFYLACGRKTNPYAPKKCDFFQWDPNGSLGTNRRYEKLSWHSFGPMNHCCLYRKSMGPAQIRQGAVGNCWFLSALAVVAEKEYLLRRIVPHTRLNQRGVYQINLCLDGKWTPIIVDSHFPVVFKPVGSLSKQALRGAVATEQQTLALPAFCAAPERQLWAALVEKAYAKVHGSYAQLSGGWHTEAWGDLTGAPTETVHFVATDPTILWSTLLSYQEAGFLMGVSTQGSSNEGLVGGHAYSVLNVIEIPNVVVGRQAKVTDFLNGQVSKRQERETVRLLRIRNP